MQIESRIQVGECSLRVQFYIDGSRCHWFRAEVLKKFFDLDVFRLKIRNHFPVRRTNRRAGAQISPDKRNGNITSGVLRLALVELNLGDLKRLTLCLQDRLKIHLVAAEKNNRDVETIRRIGGVHIGLNRLQIAVAPLRESKL